MASILSKALLGGAVTAYGVKSSINFNSANLPVTKERKANLTYEDMASRGFWNKQKTLFGMSLMSDGMFRGSGKYLGYSATQAFSNVNPINNNTVGIGMSGGALLGAGIGVAFSALTKRPMGATTAAALGTGAVLGGITARKTQLQVAESFNTVKKNLYKKPMFSNKARRVGPGYSLWTQRASMGKPGHLGVTGSLPFAMHSARHRSTV